MGRFDALRPRSSIDDQPTKPARRGNPAYRQFSAYIPEDLYRRLKIRLIESDTDLSEAIEQAIIVWLRPQQGGEGR